MQPFWQLDKTQVAARLETDLAEGLASNVAARRIEEYGPNQLEEKAGSGPLALLFAQFKSFLVWVLIGAAIVSGVLQEWVDALSIIGIVVLNAIIGFVQEHRAERSLAALKKLSSPITRVVRDGHHAALPSAALVPGDLIELEAGDHVPADGRVVSHTAGFSVQEASLTGESAPVAKGMDPIAGDDVPIGDRTNMVFRGTSVVSGRARVVVALTGMRTELGRIAGLIQEIEAEPTPLQRKLEHFGKLIVRVCFVLVGLVFALQWLRGGAVVEAFLTAVSLAVAAIPEGLPAVVTVALALGVQRMVKRHALIRKLPAVETLGCATVICSDKTGTLTRNEMTVQAVYAGGRLVRVTGVGYTPLGDFTDDGAVVRVDDRPALRQTLQSGALCSAAQLVHDQDAYRVVGDPTEGAILACAAKAGLQKADLEKTFVRVEELPFDSDRKKMSIVCREAGGGALAAHVKGAADVLLADCTRILAEGGVRPITEEDRRQVLAANAALADQAMRVLAVAYRPIDAPPAGGYSVASVERDLILAGLVAMIDPPREEAREAVATCRAAGIRAVMITGDHRNTAVAVGRALGLYGEGDRALTGEEIEKLSDAELEQQVPHIPVYARVAPEHKLRIVRAWRRRGEIVAMTGDGVNDAPAVKEADIGVAMGITGTDVTKEVSDMVVTDDNFASIVAAVEEGRGIYDNILKFVHYLLSCNTAEILVMFVAALAGLPVPLLPIHILWVNLVTDGLPALALGMDPVSPGVMRRAPRAPGEPVVGRQNGGMILGQGVFIALCTLAAFGWVLYVERGSLPQARTVAFLVLACSQLFHAFNCRSQTVSLFTLGVFTNRALLLAVGISFLLQVGAVQLPFLRVVFKAAPLTAGQWALALALSSFPLWAMEGLKALRRLSVRKKEF